MHANLTALFSDTSLAGFGSGRTFAMVSTDPNEEVEVQAGNASGDTDGPVLCTLRGPKQAINLPCGAVYVRFRVKAGTDAAPVVWVDAPADVQGPTGATGASGTADTVTATKTANYTASIGECVVCDSSGGAFAVTFPTSVIGNKGKTIKIKVITSSANAVTATRAGSDTIDAATTSVVSGTKGHAVFEDNGAGNWMLIG